MAAQNRHSFITVTRLLFAGLSAVTVIGLSSPLVLAADSSKSSSKSSSASSGNGAQGAEVNSGLQGYSADQPIDIGVIVQLVDGSSNKVTVSTKGDIGHMYGVTIDPKQLPLTMSGGDIKNEVYVATSGTYDVLVCNQNGAIQPGDYVTLSSVNGVARKAGTDDKTVFGRAAANFNGKKDGIGTVTLKDTTGKADQTVTLGMIPVAIDVRSNPDQKSTKVNAPQFLQRIGQAIADKPVSVIRLYLSAAITAATIITAVVILYAGVRNSIISIGRNPLSKKSIFAGLVSVILSGVLILIIGLFAVYLLLKL